VCVALGDPDVGVAQYLLHDADVDALLHEKCARSVTAIVDSGVADAGFPEECLPLLPVVARVDRSAVGLGEEQVMVLPG